MRVLRLIRIMLSILLLYWLSMLSLFASYSYNKGWIFANFESIDAKIAIERMQSESNLIILDVRTTPEYQQVHVDNAINIPVQLLENKLEMLRDIKHKQILVYCKSGNRSVKASRILEEHAFTPANIKGGIQQLQRHNATLIK